MRTRQGHMFKRNGIWTVQYRVDGRLHTRSTGERDRRAAETERRNIMAPFSAGTQKEVLENIAARISGLSNETREAATPPITISAAWARFLSAPSRPDSGATTLKRYAEQWMTFVRWITARHPAVREVRQVTPEIATEYAAHLRQTRGGGTFNKHVRLCSLVFRTLQPPDHHADDPFARSRIRRLRQTQVSRRELTVEELRRVCGSAEGDLRVLLALGVYTGMRLGDCATLRWGEVDLDRGIIRRVPNKSARRSSAPVQIPLHKSLRTILSSCAREGDYVIPTAAAQCVRNPSGLTRRIQAHFKSCGIQTMRPSADDGQQVQANAGKEGRGRPRRGIVEVGFHSLRHTFVSLCRNAGAPLAVVEAIVGHSSPAMTQHYTHTGADAAMSAIEMLPAIESEEPGGASTRHPAPTAVSKERADDELLAELLRIADVLNEKTWKACREEILRLVMRMRSPLLSQGPAALSPQVTGAHQTADDHGPTRKSCHQRKPRHRATHTD